MTVIGVRFKKAGKIYYFDPDGTIFERGDAVIVETARGIEYGWVELGNRDVNDDDIVMPLKKILRSATKEDKAQEAENREREKEAGIIFAEKVKKLDLKMKLVSVEFTFDMNKLIFYFTSDGRVDFRELVKELAFIFKTRIELRQIGVRDEAKMLNGIGVCGRTLCCATFLSDFQPVSIKMAKDQGISLNPAKISGICGRLMCCLKYEQDTYEELNKNLPNIGDIIETSSGTGEVLSVQPLRQIIKAAVRNEKDGDPDIQYFNVKEIKIKHHKKVKDEKIDPNELKDILD